MSDSVKKILRLVYENNLLKTKIEEVDIFSDYTSFDIYRHRVSFVDAPDDWYVTGLDLIDGKEYECIEYLLNTITIDFEIMKMIEQYIQEIDSNNKIVYTDKYKIHTLSETDAGETWTFSQILIHEFDNALYGRYKDESNFELIGKKIANNNLPLNVPYLSVQNFFESYNIPFDAFNTFEEDYYFLVWEKQKLVVELVLTILPDLITDRIKNYFFDTGWTIQMSDYKYELIKGEFIGRGSHCEVIALSNDIALKKLRTDIAKEPKAKKRLKEEFDILKKLSNHPNIIQVIEMKDEISYTMQRAKKPLRGMTFDTEKEKLEVLNTILDAVEYIHVNEVIHRDLHPNNILFLENGECVITDFGLAKDYTTQSLNTYSVGGPNHQYTAPEGLRNMKELSAQSDIYSIGILIRDDLQISSLSTVISKATSNSLSIRYKSVGELRSDIELILNSRKIENVNIDDLLLNTEKFLHILSIDQCQILKETSKNARDVINKYIEEDKLFDLFEVIDKKYIESVGYGKWHEYDIYNNYNFELIMNSNVDLITKRKAYKNLNLNHGNRFNNPIKKIPVKNRIELENLN